MAWRWAAVGLYGLCAVVYVGVALVVEPSDPFAWLPFAYCATLAVASLGIAPRPDAPANLGWGVIPLLAHGACGLAGGLAMLVMEGTSGRGAEVGYWLGLACIGALLGFLLGWVAPPPLLMCGRGGRRLLTVTVTFPVLSVLVAEAASFLALRP